MEDKVLTQLKDNFVYAVVRGRTEEEGYEIAKAAVAGGIKNIELTFSVPNATRVIEQLVEDYKDDETVIIGAGTVLTVNLAQKAFDAGARFFVSPSFSRDVAKFAREHNIHYLPGCMTPTEIWDAMTEGCEMVKLFPGAQVGPSFISDVHGPLPEVQLVPSGGVNLDNIEDWIKHGAVSVGVSSALTSEIESAGYISVTEIAKQFVKEVNVQREAYGR